LLVNSAIVQPQKTQRDSPQINTDLCGFTQILINNKFTQNIFNHGLVRIFCGLLEREFILHRHHDFDPFLLTNEVNPPEY
jgi:hypothetical protein